MVLSTRSATTLRAPPATEFIKRHLPDPFYMERDVRISLRDKIFRELVANLLVHREYTKADVARILIYKDRVEFTNPTIPHWGGNFDPTHRAVPENPAHLENVCTRLG
jgi:ATP-dependent DNA helicase RecG